MIKNIVFDMGKVMTDYEVGRLSRYYVNDEEARERVIMTVFASTEWTLLDIGVIEEQAALERMQSRLHTEQEKEWAKLCFEHWHEFNLTPRAEMGELVEELKEQGCGIYLLSNAPLRIRKCCETVIPGFESFDGIMFSAEEKLIKPQKEFYQRFFERFGLKPEECFFVDDLKENIEGGRACGMDGYCFADGDVRKLREQLERMKVLKGR